MVEAPKTEVCTTKFSQVCGLCGAGTVRTTVSGRARELKSCASCGVSVVEPRPTLENIRRSFAEVTFAADEVQHRFERNRRPVLERVAKHVSSIADGGRVLDIGCAFGTFLSDHLTGRQWRRFGIDLSPSALSQASAKGIEVQLGTISESSIAPQSVDLITALDVFYYFRDPATDLAQIRKLLCPAGLLAIEVPNATFRLWRLTTAWAGFLSLSGVSPADGDHLWFYTPKALKLLLEANGFAVLSIFPLPANRPESSLHQFIYRVVSVIGTAIWHATRARMVFSPRFLVLARTAPLCDPR